MKFARMRNEWEIDVAELESRGDVIIRTTKEFYFLDEQMCSEQSPYFSREQYKQKRAEALELYMIQENIP